MATYNNNGHSMALPPTPPDVVRLRRTKSGALAKEGHSIVIQLFEFCSDYQKIVITLTSK